MSMSTMEALHGMAAENRRRAQELWKAEGGRSHVRKLFRAWQRGPGGVPKVAQGVFSDVLASSPFDAGIWRTTSTLVLPEMRDTAAWKAADLNNFIHCVVHSSECSDAAVDRILAESPNLRKSGDAGEWLESVMLPFRSAVLTQVAVCVLEKCFGGGAARVILAKNPEWAHCAAHAPGPEGHLTAMQDEFESSLLHLSADPPLTPPARTPSIAAGRARGNPVAVYLHHHLRLAAEWGNGSGDGPQGAPGPLRRLLSGGRRRGRFEDAAAAAFEELAPAAEQGFVPAQCACACLGLVLEEKGEAARGFADRVAKRGDGLVYPVAFFAKAGLRLPAESARKHGVRWHAEFLSASEVDEDSAALLSYAPFTRDAEAYPFLRGGPCKPHLVRSSQAYLRRVGAEAERSEARRERVRAAQKSLRAFVRSPLQLTYAVLSAAIAVLLYLNFLRMYTAADDGSLPNVTNTTA
ncbi:hypothetical protein DIPPA_23557 [Diplonema papillatum]|nr:hypothetical protein DIPPA_23557 [Diplonema papillatum]